MRTEACPAWATRTILSSRRMKSRRTPRISSDSSSSGRSADVAVARKGRLRKLRKLIVVLGRPSWRRAVRKGVAAAVEHRDVPFGHDFATVVDVGAHHGQFALLALELFPRSSILCVEPLPGALDRLRATVRANGRVTTFAAAAAAKAGYRQLHVSRKTDSSSLLPILESYVDAFPGTEVARTVDVEAKTLDSMVAERIQRPCLLKVDAQGGELGGPGRRRGRACANRRRLRGVLLRRVLPWPGIGRRSHRGVLCAADCGSTASTRWSAARRAAACRRTCCSGGMHDLGARTMPCDEPGAS